MKFGFWVEPEMINPDSDLYRAHPDWAMHFPGRPRTEARNQLVLNMARDDVRDHIFSVLDKLLSDNAIDFVKWDMNRPLAEPGWENVPEAEQREIWIKFVRNMYNIMDRLRARHPSVEFEGCSGGGGRIDLELMRRVEEFWTSDNTDAFDRLKIQEGYSYIYAPKSMMAWVTDVPNMNGRSTPLRYRYLVAMQGSLGIGGNLNKWPEADLAYSSKMVEVYKWIRKTVQEGALYRLASPRRKRPLVDILRRTGRQSGLPVRLPATTSSTFAHCPRFVFRDSMAHPAIASAWSKASSTRRRAPCSRATT